MLKFVFRRFTSEGSKKGVKVDILKDSQRKTIQPPIKKEINGPKGPEPTRYGDWERNGRVYDF
jgi:hypothetical protein